MKYHVRRSSLFTRSRLKTISSISSNDVQNQLIVDVREIVKKGIVFLRYNATSHSTNFTKITSFPGHRSLIAFLEVFWGFTVGS